MRHLLIVFILINLFCSSTQIIKSANEDISKTEKTRTKTYSEIIDESSLSDIEKRILKEGYKTKDDMIDYLNKVISAYQLEATKAVDIKDKIISDSSTKIEDCARDAGKGDVLTGVFYLAIGAAIVFVIWLFAVKILPKLNIKNFTVGS